MVCKKCGFDNPDDALFCINCGSRLHEEHEKDTKESDSPGTKKCPKCGFENPEEAVFCINCGTRLEEPAGQKEKVCPNCGFVNPPTAQFCAKCGTNLVEKDKGVAAPNNVPQPQQGDTSDLRAYTHTSNVGGSTSQIDDKKDSFKKVGEIIGNEIIFYRHDNPGEFYRFPKDFVGSVIYDVDIKEVPATRMVRRFNTAQIVGTVILGLVIMYILSYGADLLGFILGVIITALMLWYGLQKVPRRYTKRVKKVYLKLILRGRAEPLILEYPASLENEVKNFARIANLWLVR